MLWTYSLSDHRLLQWPVPTSRPPPVYRSVNVRQWRLLDHSAFRTALASSSGCNPDAWSDHDADDMALVYDREITSTLDRMIPIRTVTCHQRPSDPYFDDECRAARRRVIRSTTPLCYVDFRQLTVSLALRWSGLPLTFMRENYLYGTEVPVLLRHLCYVEYPKDRSSSFCTRQTYTWTH